jgi:hypothetical protein
VAASRRVRLRQARRWVARTVGRRGGASCWPTSSWPREPGAGSGVWGRWGGGGGRAGGRGLPGAHPRRRDTTWSSFGLVPGGGGRRRRSVWRWGSGGDGSGDSGIRKRPGASVPRGVASFRRHLRRRSSRPACSSAGPAGRGSPSTRADPALPGSGLRNDRPGRAGIVEPVLLVLRERVDDAAAEDVTEQPSRAWENDTASGVRRGSSCACLFLLATERRGFGEYVRGIYPCTNW